MNSQLRTAINTKGQSVSSLTGGFYYLEAKQKCGYPYAVFSFVNNSFSRDSATKFEEFYLQINLYDTDGERIEYIKENLFNEFDDSEASSILLITTSIELKSSFRRP